MSSVQLGNTPVRAPRPVAPVGIRRDPVRPGAQVARHDGVAGARPVRGGCRPHARRLDPEPERTCAQAGTSPVRLTRRGRRLLAAVSLVFGLAIAATTGAAVLDAGSGLRPAGHSSVVVEPGDTLWSIARQVAPEEDTRAVVDAIEDVNELDSTLLVPGQVLHLP
jgi:nucleoid-associated protein YgaU